MPMWLGSWLFCVCSFCPLSGLLMSTIINSGGGWFGPFDSTLRLVFLVRRLFGLRQSGWESGHLW